MCNSVVKEKDSLSVFLIRSSVPREDPESVTIRVRAKSDTYRVFSAWSMETQKRIGKYHEAR